MTTIFVPNLSAEGGGRRESYSALIIDPSDEQDKSISPDPDGYYNIEPVITVLFHRIRPPVTKFKLQDEGTSAHVKLEKLDGQRNTTTFHLRPGDNFIQELGVFHRRQGNKEVE